LLNRISHLLNRISHLLNRISHLLNRISHLLNRISHLLNRISHLLNRIPHLLSYSYILWLFVSNQGEGSSFTLVRKISQVYTIFNFQLIILIYSCDLLMIFSLVNAWSAWLVPPLLQMAPYTVEVWRLL